MSDVLRLGGPVMAATAQDGLNQPPDKLRELADRDYWEDTPLAAAYTKDRDNADTELDALNSRRDNWKKPLDGLETPGGFTVSEFYDPPGSPGDDTEDFHSQTGLTQWVADRFWKSEGDFYEDPTPLADEQTVKAVTDLGTPLYSEKPYDPSLPTDERERQYYEERAFEDLTDGFPPTGADDARLFLSYGGFPRTAPQPGTAEHRIAVEDLKTRFASCAWRDPIDPNTVLGGIADTAAAEWQEEVAAQAGQRDRILDANEEATKALAAGAKSLGEMLGNSWVADHLVQWQDYWSAGGLGWIGDSHAVIELPAAKGKCLDVAGGKSANGTPVQVYTCNGSSAQQWQLEGGDQELRLMNVASQKCLDVAGNNPANGTKIRIYTCNQSPAQTWQYDPRAVTALKSVGTGKCVDLDKFTDSHDALLSTCDGTGQQQFRIKPSGHNGTDSLSYPDTAQFNKAKTGVAAAQTKAAKELALLKAQAAVARKAVTATDTAEKAAYAIADERGAPRGRGLLVGQQKAQVTKGAAAALEAMVKAGETAAAATRASAGDSATIAQRALAQAAQSKAEFRREAAHAAELQAKASADAAKLHRDNAKKDEETAEAKLAEAVKAEGEAKKAAADAHAERLAAEAEEKTAEAEKKKADAKKAEAAGHRKTAESEATKAKDAKDRAEAAEGTASDKRDAAVKARDKARDLRDDAWDAEQKADAARAKADAKEAYAQAHESDSNAQEARAAADAAAGHADDAEAAAVKARSAADAATKAAADADAAATRAEAAAERSRAHADDAQAAKLKADAAVKTATSAAADAIQAAKHAASEAKAAVALADEAEQEAKTARTHANEAGKEATKAVAASATAAGFAHVTAQAAVDAGNSAQQVAAPANDAIQLGSPYVTTDSAAGLVVLTGQASKSIAEQQKAVAEAHAKNAQAEASAAKNLADQAKGDAKQAYVHAASATGHASDARGYAKEALGYAADAALAASKAAASLTRTVEYDRRATEDAEAADKAAGRAEGHAAAARDSADEAALDAEAARTAATEAEEAARDARSAADRADAAATEAEEAAKDAQKYAEEAQEAASRTETETRNNNIRTGTSAGGIGNVFHVDRIETIGDPENVKKENCNVIIHIGDCRITATIRYKVEIDVYLCTALELPATQAGCPEWETLFLGTQSTEEQKSTVTKTISMVEFNSGVDPVAILLGHWIECAQKVAPGGESGSWGGCGWAAFDIGAFVFGGKITQAVVDGIRALDASLRTGIGVGDAYRALRTLNMDAAALANISRTVAAYEDDVATACKAVDELARAARSSSAAAAANGLPCKFWKLTEFQGQRVYQRDDLIRPDYVSPNDNYGRTNLKRMQQGLAPMGPDDNPLNLHHMLQTQDGPIAEVTKKMHLDENYHQLHWKSGTKIPSGIDRPEFDAWKKLYWKNRAKEFGG